MNMTIGIEEEINYMADGYNHGLCGRPPKNVRDKRVSDFYDSGYHLGLTHRYSNMRLKEEKESDAVV